MRKNEKLNELLTEEIKENLLNLLEGSLYDNIIDELENSELRYLELFSEILLEYSLEGVEQYNKIKIEYDIEIRELFKWLEKETPFVKKDFSMEDFFDTRNISDYKTGKHIMRNKTLLDIKEKLVEMQVKESQIYINYFIFRMYIKNCILRIEREKEKYEKNNNIIVIDSPNNKNILLEKSLKEDKKYVYKKNSFQEFSIEFYKICKEKMKTSDNKNILKPPLLFFILITAYLAIIFKRLRNK